jgi:hypothetical protein
MSEGEPTARFLDPAGRTRRLALLGALGLPVVVAIIAAFVADWSPVSDWALIELRVRDVGSGTPLVGPFSRYGWNHPGPFLFWYLAVVYRVLGSASEALLVGAGLVNLASVAGIGWLAWRRGGGALLAWTGLVLSLFLHGQGATFLFDPWNPTVVMLPFALLCFATWSMSEGDHRLAPLWVLAASWIVQAHVGFTPFVGVLGVWALAWLLAHDRSRSVRRWLAASALLAALLWLPPLVEQLTESPGNAEQIARHFAGNDEEVVGGAMALEVYGRHLSLAGIWAGAEEPTDIFTGEVIGGSVVAAIPLLVLFAASAAMAARAGRADAVRLAGQTALGLAVGVVAGARITGYAFPYLFGWLEVLVMFVWISIGWSAYRSLSESAARTVLRGVPALAGAAVLVSAITAIEARDPDPPLVKEVLAVREVGPDAAAAVGDRTALLTNSGTCLSEAGYGVALQIERGGGQVVVRDDLTSRFGEHRRWDGTNADVEVTVVCREEIDASIARAEADPDDDLVLVASYDPRSPELVARADEIEAALVAEIEDMGRADLLEDLDTGWILFSGADAGVPEEVLGPYRELFQTGGDRVVVLVGPPPPAP